MISSEMVSTTQKVNKNLPSRYFARNQKNIRLGNVQVRSTISPHFSGPRIKKQARLNIASGTIAIMVSVIAFSSGIWTHKET